FKGSIRDLVADLVVAAQNATEDSLHLGFIGEDRLIVTPNDGQPFARHDQLGSDRDRGQKAVEISESIILSGGDLSEDRNASSASRGTPSTGTFRSTIVVSAC